MALIPIDNQPISAGFFHQGKWLTDFITPGDLDVEELYHGITDTIQDPIQKLSALQQWVGSNIKYVHFVNGQLKINGRVSYQKDLWNPPAITADVGVGNCANSSFLLTSLVRNLLPAEQVHCVLGNLYNGHKGGHAWTQVKLQDGEYIMEATTNKVPPLVSVQATERYEPVHLFNDKEVWAHDDRAVMEPYSSCYSQWLQDYLDWSFISAGGRAPSPEARNWQGGTR